MPQFIQLGSATCGSLHLRNGQSFEDLRERFRVFVRDFAFRPESHIFVVRSDTGDYAGHVWLNETTNRFNGNKELWIWDVSVESRFQRQGLGRALMDFAKERASSLNCDQLWLLVADQNEAAKSLYLASGLSSRAQMMCLDSDELMKS
ncbi:MAG: GNAT family N-acetyltransferase [Calditrichaeota bacterium]|nr:GNAT family N-acetyltransferase [Calditrichota bacterium]MCB9366318.1 GNAT family N-acetyltransferase [Calditrichota bacterium]